MNFGSQHLLWLLLLLPLGIGYFIYIYQRLSRSHQGFAHANLLSKLTTISLTTRRIISWTLILLFILFAIIALARPRFGLKMEMFERKGIDIMVCLDISKSMLAEDIKPNRLERARYETTKFFDLLKGDRIGLTIFAGDAFVQCPLTLDYGAAKMFLDAVTPDWIPIPGTALATAIDVSEKAFASTTKKHKVLIIISDGEDHDGDPLAAAKEASANGTKIYTIGIGTLAGVPLPEQKGNGSVIYKKDNAGNLVLSKLNPEILEDLARIGNGRYFHAGTDLDLALIYSEIMKMEKKDLGINAMSTFEEQYQVFLFIAMILLIAEFFVAHTFWARKL